MNERNSNNRKSAKDRFLDSSKFVRNSASKAVNVFANNVENRDKSRKMQEHEHDQSENEINRMRLILPTFIANEQKYAQTERRRNIQSSPAKSLRRYSQNSSHVERQLNVSGIVDSITLSLSL